jgi:hAT family C-terminal dimerisation region
MDYLPVQATSVPCERVFSSAKETDTKKRNRMSPLLMEALQLLKFALKKERLDFIDGWATLEAAMLGAPKITHDLGSLFVENDDSVMDSILSECTAYDD